MKKKHIISILGTIVSLCIIAALLIYLGKASTTPPTEDEIRKDWQFFLIKPLELKGHFGNSDIDAGIFSYKTSESQFWTKLEDKILAHNWQKIGKKNGINRYKLSKDNWSTEVRIKYLDDKKSVIVAYMHNHDSEGEWYEQNFWNKIETIKTEQF